MPNLDNLYFSYLTCTDGSGNLITGLAIASSGTRRLSSGVLYTPLVEVEPTRKSADQEATTEVLSAHRG